MLEIISPLADKKVVLILVQYDGLALKYAYLELQSNDEILLIAMHENMLASSFAYPELKGNARKEKLLTCLA